MDLPSGIFSQSWIWTAWVVYGLVMFWAMLGCQWWRLADRDDAPVFYGAVICVMLLWTMRAGITPGLNFHLLGVTALTLMFGWRYALMATSLAMLGITLIGQAGWETLAMNVLIMGAIPALFTSFLLRIAQTHLPHNFFIYIFINGFVAGGLSGILVGLTTVGALLGADVHDMERLSYEYLPYFPLMFFPEGFFNGMLMTLIIGLRPQWAATFSDDMYLKGK